MAFRGGQTWRNWSRLESARPKTVISPDSVEQVSDIVAAATQSGRKVRMIGSGHSFTGAAVANDLMLTPGGLSGVRSIDQANSAITVDAGIGLTSLCLALEGAGLAMSNMGDVRVQTLAGALQTGTHGTGRDAGTFASMVAGLELVTANGEVLNASLEENEELFRSATVGLGAYGILTGVTLNVEPGFRLHAHEFPATFDETLDNLNDWVAEHDHTEVYWFPHTEVCSVKLNDRTQDQPAPLSKRRAWFDDQFLANTVYGGLCRFTRTAPGYTGPINRFVAKLLSDRQFTDESWKVFTSERSVRFAEMEYALPREALIPALRDVKQLLDDGPWHISFPIEVRVIPGDESWLSPSFGRDTGYIAIHAFDRTDRSYFEPVEAIMKSYGGRPHWGKLHTRTAADLADSYPHWDQAQDIRKRLDPTGTFSNDYTTTVLG